MATNGDGEEEPKAPELGVFRLSIQDNPGGWGPLGIPEQFRELPFQHFAKGDKIGASKCLLFGLG